VKHESKYYIQDSQHRPLSSVTLGSVLISVSCPELAVSCKHSSVMWVVGHTTPTYCRYLPGG